MVKKAEFCGKWNVAIAFMSLSLTCSSLVYANTPSSMKSTLAQVLTGLGAGRSKGGVTASQFLGSSSQTTTTSQPPLNTAAFGIPHQYTVKTALPMTPDMMTILKDSNDVVARLDTCKKMADPTGKGPINDDCLLRQFNHGSGLVEPTAMKLGPTNWANGDALPGAFDGSKEQADMNQHLKDMSAGTLEEAQNNYSIAIGSNYEDYSNALSAQLQKNYASQLPGVTPNWFSDGMRLDFSNGSTLTFKGGVAGG